MHQWLSAEQQRRLFLDTAKAATDYREAAHLLPHVPQVGYREALERFDAPLPEGPVDAHEVVADLQRLSDGALMLPVGPRFYGWVIGASHPVGVAADWLAAAWGQNAGNHHASPAASAAEEVAGRWLVDLLGLPQSSAVGFATGATMANLTCLAAARDEVLRRVGWDAPAQGLFGAPELRVLIGADAHATVFLGLQLLGLGRERVTRVATDSQGRMSPDALRAALAEGPGQRQPAVVILQAGQINTGACDRFDQLIPIAHAAGAWVHVDGAFGLWARAAPERAHLAAGVEAADSWATDAHKWPQVPYDCGVAIVREEAHLRQAMSFTAAYLPEAEADERDPSHYVPELSRRARGFATWAVLRALGRSGVAELIERHCRIAAALAERLAAAPGVAILNDVELNQVAVRFGDSDELTLRTIARIQQDGVLMAGASAWRGQQIMRLSVSGGATDDAEVGPTVTAILAAWDAVRAADGAP
ncbi:MAG: aminotransferase class V-fold PLP-dependent enzyme [Nocardioides sp.]